jgi:Zn-finger protein
MNSLTDRLELVEKHGGAFQGRKEILKHLNGEVTTAREAIKGKCYDCMCYFEDGRSDCKIETCPLYPFMAYREGGVRKSRVRSDDQKNAVKLRFKNRLK